MFFLFCLLAIIELALRNVKFNISFIDQLYDYNSYNALYTKKNINHKFNDIEVKYSIKEFHNRVVSNDNLNSDKNILILGDSLILSFVSIKVFSVHKSSQLSY
jgi:hypothetical protein